MNGVSEPTSAAETAPESKAESRSGHGSHAEHGTKLWPLMFGALGVVYGDIGTSPLYAIRECFQGEHSVPLTPNNIFGILSLMFWSLTLVVVVKYLTFVMRADNRGEGGILALLALVLSGAKGRGTFILVLLGIFGSALLFADGMITPAISVLSAIEGLKVATPIFEKFVVPITVGILVGLFLVQKRGTAGIAAVFGPAMVTWFLLIAVLGLPWIIREPGVLRAVSPVHAVQFFFENRMQGFLVLGAIVLCITGSEALYADMGHFGRRPIQFAWYAIVFPALLINYFGQGALLLSEGRKAAENPFFALAPGWALYPVVFIATSAAIIASQALISGAFSLARQAVQLGYLPRVKIVHTSDETEGQIYVPEVNAMLMIACVFLVILFKSSSNLAAAYGISVMGTMAITSCLIFPVARYQWGWGFWGAALLSGSFLALDLPFFAANLVKLFHGGWFPLAVALSMFVVMTTWKRGRIELTTIMKKSFYPLDLFLAELEISKPYRVPGTAVFMTSDPTVISPSLLHHFKHSKVLHEQVILLSVVTEGVPFVTSKRRVAVEDLSNGFFRVIARYGFMQTPDAGEIIAHCPAAGLKVDMNTASFYLGRETLLITGGSQLPRWRKALFAFLSRNAQGATVFFGIPPDRVVELGIQVQI